MVISVFFFTILSENQISKKFLNKFPMKYTKSFIFVHQFLLKIYTFRNISSFQYIYEENEKKRNFAK